MITDAMLKEAACELETALIEAMPDPKTFHHDFSEKFERKMKKALFRANHPFVAQLGRRVAAAILVLLLMGSSVLLFVPSARAAFVGWVREVYENCYHYFVPAQGRALPDDVPTSYRPGWLPEGTVLVDQIEVENGTTIIFADMSGNMLQFSYYINPKFTVGNLFLETDGHMCETVMVGKEKADLFINTDGFQENSLVWEDESGLILFQITAQLRADVLIRIAENVVPDIK